MWPLPREVKEAIDDYLRLDRQRREFAHSGGEHDYLFQPHMNYRTLDFDKLLSTRMVQKLVKKWVDYSCLGDLSPHDLRRTVITKALDSGLTYRQVQILTRGIIKDVLTKSSSIPHGIKVGLRLIQRREVVVGNRADLRR